MSKGTLIPTLSRAPIGTDQNAKPLAGPALARVLTVWPLLFYGLEVIIGAGIYVAIGAVMEHAGAGAPLSFLFAGIAAGATGLCYAELAGRFPEASGAVSYVRHGLGSDRLAQITGALLTLSTAVSAATIAQGAVHYLTVLLPMPVTALIVFQVVTFTAIAAFGVRSSVWLAAALGIVEIAGLGAATIAGLWTAPAFDLVGMIPKGPAAWHAVMAGAFLAFFAFIGFETLANLAEEAKQPRETVPRSIVGAIAASIVIYVVVAATAVLAHSPATSPLLSLFSGQGVVIFAVVAALSVANGVLVHIITLARLFYGMAARGQLPALFARVHPRTHTPIRATVFAGGIVLATSLFLPFEQLLIVTNTATLAIFVLVDLALWRVQRNHGPVAGFAVPRWIPLFAAALAIGLVAVEWLS